MPPRPISALIRRCWLILLITAFGSLRSQVPSVGAIVGRVVDGAAREPIAGAIVLLLDGRGATVARTITDASGRYRLSPDPKGAALRAMRIGFSPTVQAWSLTTPTPTPIELALRRLPAILAAMTVIEQPQCPADSNGALAFAIWDQARTALLATLVAQEANPALLHMISYDRTLSPDRKELRDQVLHDSTFRSTRGVVSQREASEYAKLGYRDADPTTGRERYYAPDAQVLLDPAFAATHCLTFRGATVHDADEVGLAFVPKPGTRTRVDVSGAIWIRRTAPALRAIDFHFTNTSPARDGSDTLAGGTMQYREMPNGVPLPVLWDVHAPLRTRDQVRLGSRTLNVATNQVTGIRESGGVVESARWDDGSVWSANLPRAGGRVIDGDRRPIATATVSVRGTTLRTRVDSSGAFTLPPLVDGRYAVDVVDTSLAPFGLTREATVMMAIGAPTAPRLTAMLPSARTFVDSLCTDEKGDSAFIQSPSLLLGAVRLSDGSPAANATIRAVWSASDSTRDRPMLLEGESDANGRFYVCGIPVGTVLSLSATRAGSVAPDTSVVVSASDGIAAAVMTLTTASDSRLPAYRRRILHVDDAATRAPIGEAEVTDAVSDRTLGRTSTAGDFPLGMLPPGSALLRVRKPGYAARLLMLSLRPGDSTSVNTSLQRIATLDAVQVTAAAGGRKALAAGFETRAAQRNGRFLTMSDLKRFDGESLERAIRSLGLRERHMDFGDVLLGGRGKPCPVTIFVDGVLFYSFSWRGIPPPDAGRMLASEYSAVEYYADDALAPAGFSTTGAGCGTLILWTRD